VTLIGNRPNPFNPATTISFKLQQTTDYTLTIYNVRGQVVATLPGTGQPGINEVTWDASGNPSGIYFYRFQAGDFVASKKMLLMK
jgi:hypothetical protein